MKTTTTLMESMVTELAYRGQSEIAGLIDGVGWQVGFGRVQKIAIIGRLARYDDKISAFVDDYYFQGFQFDPKIDREFKKMFMNRNINREIADQTIDLFINHLVSKSMAYAYNINNLMLNLDKYYSGLSTSNTTGGGKTGYNRGNADLPQSDPSLDLHQDVMTYANTNEIQRAYDQRNQNTQTNKFDPDVFDKLNDQLEKQLRKFDSLFLGVW